MACSRPSESWRMRMLPVLPGAESSACAGRKSPKSEVLEAMLRSMLLFCPHPTLTAPLLSAPMLAAVVPVFGADARLGLGKVAAAGPAPGAAGTLGGAANVAPPREITANKPVTSESTRFMEGRSPLG